MITVCVPDERVAAALGDLGEGARIVVWDPRESDVPESERDRITIACIEHYSGGRTVFGRLAAGVQVLSLLTDVCRTHNATVVIITHNAMIAPLGNRVIRVKNGGIESIETCEHPARVEDIAW